MGTGQVRRSTVRSLPMLFFERPAPYVPASLASKRIKAEAGSKMENLVRMADNSHPAACREPKRKSSMNRTYEVIDSDGHVLEPPDFWVNYLDPIYRDRAPQLFVDNDGKE